MDCYALTTFDMPNSVKYCSGFDGCTNLNSINLSDSLEFMPLFMGCSSLKTLKIPDKASYVDGFGNFIGCDNLTSFTVGDNHLWYFSEDGVLFRKDGYNGQSQLSVFPPGKPGESVIPDHVIQLAQGASSFYL
jgi:hypothetical protein